MRSLKKQAGFTLVELVIVMVLIGVVATISSLMIAQGVGGSQGAKREDAIAWNARIPMARMAREIREANPDSIITATVTQFSFIDATGTTITYTLVGTELYRDAQLIADDITIFAFLYYDETGAAAATTADIRYVLFGIQLTIDGVASRLFINTIAIRNAN